MKCILKWNTLDLPTWKQKFASIPRTTLLQSYEYAQGICNLNYQTARWGVIFIDNQEAGLVQIFEAKLFGQLVHGVLLDRGPLWFKGFGNKNHIEAFAKTFHQTFRPRVGRKRRFIPEYTVKNLTLPGFTHEPDSAYQTIWVSTNDTEDERRARLKKNWRYSLRKAEQENLDVIWDWDGVLLTETLKQYKIDKHTKNYNGPSVKLLSTLARYFGPTGQMLIGQAYKNKRPIAGILVFCHGQAATYQIGWTSVLGRDTGAHNLLLWNALDVLQQRGINDLDLGGLNDQDAKGVKRFKMGMGGALVTLPGLYR